MRGTLFIVGAFFELAGIILVASPDLIPETARASVWVGRRYQRFREVLARRYRGIAGRARVLVRRPLRRRGPQYVTIHPALEGDRAMPLVPAQDPYRPLRLVGVGALVVGLVCVTVANFV
jgi:hypothetical protein